MSVQDGKITPAYLDDLVKKLKSIVHVETGKLAWEPVLHRGFGAYVSLPMGEPYTMTPGHNPQIPLKAEQVIESFFASLGLGRGIDVTRRQPFAEKTPTQVKRVAYDDLLGTDEGGHVSQFTEFVKDEVEFGANIGASIDIKKIGEMAAGNLAVAFLETAPVKISISQEASRTKVDASVVIGIRILNRTVGFRQWMDRVPHHREHLIIEELAKEALSDGRDESKGIDLEKALELVSENLRPTLKSILGKDDKRAEAGKEDKTPPPRDFETNLTEWVLKYINKARKAREMKTDAKPLENIDDVSEDDLKDLEDACDTYTRSTGVTHYVSSIQLGAEIYKTITYKAYTTLLKASASGNILNIASIHGKTKEQSNGDDDKDSDGDDGDGDDGNDGKSDNASSSSAAEVHWMKNNIVNQATEKELGRVTHAISEGKSTFHVQPKDEAVIGYDLRPVASLIMNKKLARYMAEAAKVYILEKTEAIVGPFHIAAHDLFTGQTVYLKKGKGDELAATTNQAEADGFKIHPSDNPEEFHIIYEAKDEDDGMHADTFPFYLTTRHTWMGYGKEPPSLQQHPKESNALFAFHDQVHRVFNSKADMESGLLTERPFLINCEGRRLAFDGYLGIEIKRRGSSEKGKASSTPVEDKFTPICTRYTPDDDDLLLAFRFLRPKKPSSPPAVNNVEAGETTPKQSNPAAQTSGKTSQPFPPENTTQSGMTAGNKEPSASED